ncbi:hypothetical protein Emag_005634 [Eimeria magna]
MGHRGGVLAEGRKVGIADGAEGELGAEGVAQKTARWAAGASAGGGIVCRGSVVAGVGGAASAAPGWCCSKATKGCGGAGGAGGSGARMQVVEVICGAGLVAGVPGDVFREVAKEGGDNEALTQMRG